MTGGLGGGAPSPQSFASPRARRVFCTWATPIPPGWAGLAPVRWADDFCYASRISTRIGAGRHLPRQYSRIWHGWGSTGMGRFCSSRSGSRSIGSVWRNWRHGGWSIRVSAAGRRSEREVAASAGAPHGPDGAPLYPGTCRRLSADEAGGPDPGWSAACVAAGHCAGFGGGHRLCRSSTRGWARVLAEPAMFGDLVLGRRDAPASYHLCVTCDDAAQGVTHVTRGEDLLPATHVHRLLQFLFGWKAPVYAHHGLFAGYERRAAVETRWCGEFEGVCARRALCQGRSCAHGRADGLDARRLVDKRVREQREGESNGLRAHRGAVAIEILFNNGACAAAAGAAEPDQSYGFFRGCRRPARPRR